MEGPLRESSREMISWLEDKSPDVWMFVTSYLNWDFSEKVLHWIISQQTCDKANAAWVFWNCQPDEFVADRSGDDHLLFQTVLKRWKAGLYQQAEIALDQNEIEGLGELYNLAIDERPDGLDPYNVPLELFGPFYNRPPNVPGGLHPDNNQDLVSLLEGLGTTISRR